MVKVEVEVFVKVEVKSKVKYKVNYQCIPGVQVGSRAQPGATGESGSSRIEERIGSSLYPHS